MFYGKSRGQRRKLKTLFHWIDELMAFVNTNRECEHFHVPCGVWLANPKTSGKVKTAFCKKWIEKTEEFIDKKPKELPFCKVVAAITYPNVHDSQIIIFYDEEYYASFWDRKGPEQIWTPVKENTSFAKERGIETELPEVGYVEEFFDEDYNTKSYIWFYGECL
ncbi:MAG: DUF3916 domain-containing protein [Lachnospiraceae bacterium]|nr:DUF3916 domain-containing protein [Lachnospiraceae bacterium]